VRCRRFIEIVVAEGLADNATARGNELLAGLRSMSQNGNISNVRGLGTLVAFTVKDAETRDGMLSAMFEKGLMVLACGQRAVRFRLPLVFEKKEVQILLERVEACLPSGVGA
jgi:L-lysine 6-transaminase